MPQRRIATAILEARGSFLRHPERKRARADEPQPEGELGPPPPHLSLNQQEVWDELAEIIPPGVAVKSDRIAFEVLVSLMEKFRKGKAKTGEVSQISSLLARMGLTPADRSRVTAILPPTDEDREWDEFVSERGE